MAHTGPTPHQFDKWNCQVFINIKNFYFHITFWGTKKKCENKKFMSFSLHIPLEDKG